MSLMWKIFLYIALFILRKYLVPFVRSAFWSSTTAGSNFLDRQFNECEEVAVTNLALFHQTRWGTAGGMPALQGGCQHSWTPYEVIMASYEQMPASCKQTSKNWTWHVVVPSSVLAHLGILQSTCHCWRKGSMPLLWQFGGKQKSLESSKDPSQSGI